jgi:hypothetical protein
MADNVTVDITETVDEVVAAVTSVVNEVSVSIIEAATGPQGIQGEKGDTPTQFGTPPNYTDYDSDGTFQAHGAATCYEDINFKLSTGKLSGLNQPDWTALVAPFSAYAFKVNDELQCPAEEARHDWAVGTSMEVHVHIITNGVNTSDRYVKHRVQLMWANTLNSAGTQRQFATVETFEHEMLIPANTPDRTHIVASVGTIAMTGGLVGAYIGAFYKRIASTGTAPSSNPFVIAVGLHYQRDMLGSRTMYVK